MQVKFQHNGFDFQFSDKDIVNLDDFIPAGEYNPHNVRPWFIHEHGFCLGVVFASSEQDALDEMADKDKLDQFQVSEDEYDDYYDITGELEPNCTLLGNASEPFDIESVEMFPLPIPKMSFAALFTHKDD